MIDARQRSDSVSPGRAALARLRGMTRHGLGFAVGMALGCGSLLFLATAAGARSPSCEQVERYTLNNGLEVVLRPDHELPNVALVSSVHAGARNDPAGYEGLAHYVEHLTFRESLSLVSVLDLYKQAGATQLNGVTQLDTTNYFAQLPREQVERGLWIEARRLAIGLDALTAGPAEEEHRVVQREHELRFGSGPLLEVQNALYEALFPAGHPYHELRRQTESSVGALTLPDARWFFARYYRPDRVRLSLVGDFEPATVKVLIEKYFGALAPRAVPPSPGAAAGTQAEQAAAECRRAQVAGPVPHGSVRIVSRGRAEAVNFLWPVPLSDDAQRWWGVLDLFRQRVADAARDAKLASGAQLNRVPGELGDFWLLSVDLLPAQPLEKVGPLVSSVFAELKRSPPAVGEQTAERQALDLQESRERSSLSRALDLAVRECQVSRCLGPTDQLSPETLAGIDAFDPGKALRLELRHSVSASIDGDVERVP
jgi:zinc protease